MPTLGIAPKGNIGDGSINPRLGQSQRDEPGCPKHKAKLSAQIQPKHPPHPSATTSACGRHITKAIGQIFASVVIFLSLQICWEK